MWGKILTGAGIGVATMGVGSAIGGAYAGQTDGNAAQGATVGGVVGLGAGVGTVAIGSNLDTIGKWAGTKAINAGKGIWNYSKSPQAKALASKVGRQTLAFGQKAGALGLGVGGFAGATGATMAIKAGAKYGNIASSMFELNKGGKGGLLKTTWAGKAALGAGALISGGVQAFNTFENARAGTSDGQVLTATPTMARSSNMRNAGATGDLAFAAYAQRHG